MDILNTLEDKEDLALDSQNLKDFDKDIMNDRLENAYVNFIEACLSENPNTTIENIELLRKFLEYLKKNI